MTVCACAIFCWQGFLKGLEGLHCFSVEQILHNRDRFLAQLKVSFGQHPPDLHLSGSMHACCCGFVRNKRAWVSCGKALDDTGDMLYSDRAPRVLD